MIILKVNIHQPSSLFTMHAKEILGAMFCHLAALIYLCGEAGNVKESSYMQNKRIQDFLYVLRHL
jgi:hypothetical protein